MFTMPRLEHITISAPNTDLNSLMGNFMRGSNQKIEWYEHGEAFFFTLDGRKVNQAKMKDIDWAKMQQEAHKFAEANADESEKNSVDRDEFIAIREMVHARPSSFVDRNGVWYQEDSMSDDMSKSVELYHSAWENALKNAQPDDTLTHWTISL